MEQELRNKTLQTYNASTLQTSRSLSPRQMSDREKFLQTFPSIDRVYIFFSPNNWGWAVKNAYNCITTPCIPLADIDEVYQTPEAAKRIVRSQFIGVYSLSTARETYNEQASDIAADLFLSKYGYNCNLYDLLLYFGNYLTDYKVSFVQYDVQDILLQYSKRYLSWRSDKLRIDTQEPIKRERVTIEEAVYQWIAKGCTDEEIKDGWLYQTGMITDVMINNARDEYKAAQEAGVF